MHTPIALKHPNLHPLRFLPRSILSLLTFHLPLDLGFLILDSSACLSSLTFTSPLPMVTLDNGSQTIAKGIGSACPLPSLFLTFVFYVPDSPFNLISIRKLSHDLNCLITFSDHFVTL